MFWLPLLLVSIAVLAIEFFFTHNWLRAIIIIAVSIVLSIVVIAADYTQQTTDKEIWSGTIVDWDHNEEYDYWVPPSTSCSTDAKGIQSCTTTPGYMVHVDASNRIKTTDKGWISVSKSPDGKEFNDSWPNDEAPLKEYWKEGTPSASVHTYVNKINASYSVYKHPDVSLDDYPDLPPYPVIVRDKFFVDRILGEVPNKQKANDVLSSHNSRLNKMIPDPENAEKKISWKQVNIMFVNVGPGKTEDYGFALQDSWQGGNKNDFVVSFSMEKDGTLNWVYPFSWSESELLKLEVRDYLMDQKQITDFVPAVDHIASLVEDKFVRKEFSDFNYLRIYPSTGAIAAIWIFGLLAILSNVFFLVAEQRDERTPYGRTHLQRAFPIRKR